MMSTSDIINSIIDRPVSKSAAPPKVAEAPPKAPFFPFKSLNAGRLLNNGNKAATIGRSTNCQPKHETERPAQKKQQRSEAQAREEAKRIALLRASNRGDISLDAVSDIVRQIEADIGPVEGQCHGSAPAHSTPLVSTAVRHTAPRLSQPQPGRPAHSPCTSSQRPPTKAHVPPRGYMIPEPVSSRKAPRKKHVSGHLQKKNADQRPMKESVKRRIVGGVPQPVVQAYQPRLAIASFQQPPPRDARVSQKSVGKARKLDYSEEDSYSDIDDFIDDSPSTGGDWMHELRSVTGYDPSRFKNQKEEEATESSLHLQAWEERRSAAIAKREDEEELRKLQAQQVGSEKAAKRPRVT